MRGYNGNLVLNSDELRIERGLKALLVRKTWSVERRFACTAIREVWFQRSTGRWGWPGYVLLVDGADSPADDFVARVRDERAVTFLNRSDEWRSFAETIAKRCAAPLREFPLERRGSREVVRSAIRGGDREGGL
jgi:hypothetical protein